MRSRGLILLVAGVVACDGTQPRPSGNPDGAPDSGYDGGVEIDVGWLVEPHDAGPIDALPRVQAPLGEYLFVPPGTFLRGSDEREFGHEPAQVRSEVTLTRGFLLKAHEVTQAEWVDVMGTNPVTRSECGPDCPVTEINWLQAADFLNRLSSRESYEPCYVVDGLDVDFVGLDCTGYRFPTEAEWEYACRSGSNIAAYPNGHYPSPERELYPPCELFPPADEIGWYCGNTEDIQPVGLKPENAWGFEGMHGNVAEFAHDWFSLGYQSVPPSRLDPIGPEHAGGADHKSVRSSGYLGGRTVMSCAHRGSAPLDTVLIGAGLRPARTSTASP